MTTLRWTLTLVLALGLAVAGFAGEKHDRCEMSTQDCLNKMTEKLRTKGYLGIATEKNDYGRYVVTAVSADSPAARAGFQSGDTLLALNGVSLYAKEKGELKGVKSGLRPGSELTYTVKRGAGKATLQATLAEVPEAVLAEWIGEHMIDQHAYVHVASH